MALAVWVAVWDPRWHCHLLLRAHHLTWSAPGLTSCVCALLMRRARTFEDCVSWARMRFQDYYYNRVAQVRQ